MVGIFFGINTREAILRGNPQERQRPIAANRDLHPLLNERREPFIWTKTPDHILPHATGGQRT
jgi:hypothetical protein